MRIFLPSFFIALAALTSGCGRATPVPPADASDQLDQTRSAAIRDPDDWTKAETLPLIRATPLRPIAAADEFKARSGGFGYEFPREYRDPEPPEEEPYASDEEAVAAAIRWIERHFGKSPAHTSLRATRIQHSSSGQDRPRYDWDRGHTIVFEQTYRGLPTDRYAVVYITGRTRFKVDLDVCEFQPIENSGRKIVGPEDGVAAWRKGFEDQGASPEDLAEFDKNVSPRLSFVWSPQENLRADRDRTVQILAPNWDLFDGAMIDAYTGKPWRDD
ncbi:MAG: hypothetical protein WD066_01270 [Planctomycetaceae bacterium]